MSEGHKITRRQRNDAFLLQEQQNRKFWRGNIKNKNLNIKQQCPWKQYFDYLYKTYPQYAQQLCQPYQQPQQHTQLKKDIIRMRHQMKIISLLKNKQNSKQSSLFQFMPKQKQYLKYSFQSSNRFVKILNISPQLKKIENSVSLLASMNESNQISALSQYQHQLLNKIFNKKHFTQKKPANGKYEQLYDEILVNFIISKSKLEYIVQTTLSLEYDQQHNRTYIIIDMERGFTLDDEIFKKLKGKYYWQYLYDFWSGLIQLGKKYIIHNDIKCSNIICVMAMKDFDYDKKTIDDIMMEQLDCRFKIIDFDKSKYIYNTYKPPGFNRPIYIKNKKIKIKTNNNNQQLKEQKDKQLQKVQIKAESSQYKKQSMIIQKKQVRHYKIDQPTYKQKKQMKKKLSQQIVNNILEVIKKENIYVNKFKPVELKTQGTQGKQGIQKTQGTKRSQEPQGPQGTKGASITLGKQITQLTNEKEAYLQLFQARQHLLNKIEQNNNICYLSLLNIFFQKFSKFIRHQ